MANIPYPGRLPSILLSRKPRFTDSRNDTTATAKSKHGYTMAVSFWMEHPPHLSLFSINCTKPPHVLSQDLDFSVLPHVVGADGPFVLLRATFYAAAGESEYFLYKAGRPPSLERIPSPGELDDLSGVREWGIVGRGGDGHYLLAALRDAPASESGDGYQLRIYSSETNSWSTRILHNPCPGVDRVIPDKMITLGQEGLLGWVDLSHGLLVCDLLLLLRHQDPVPAGAPVSCFIPLPAPLPGNRYKLKYPFALTQKMKKHPSVDEESRSASWFRDLAYVNGVLKFVEMETHPAPYPQNKEDSIIDEQDLIMSLKHKPDDEDSWLQLSSFRDAWRAVTWTRKLVWPPSSPNFWRQTCAAHVADLKKCVELLAFRELYSAFPILSPEDGDDIIYLRSLGEPSDGNGWVAALHIGNKEIKAVGKYYLPDDFYYDRCFDPEHPFRASTLSRHLDITPGIEVSACRKIPEASSSANHPSNTSICIGELSSCKPRSKIQRQSEFAEDIKRVRNRQKISQVHPVENYMQEKWCLPPLYSLPLHENYQPQQEKWCLPPVYPLRLHENYQQPQRCFDKPKGPCGPGSASLTPVHVGHSYQPLCPPSEHQLTSSSDFKPQEAPQTCFNNYAGYSQQQSAPNPFAYSVHTGYGNCQEQWWPIGASSQQHAGYGNYQQQWWPIGASSQQPAPVVQRQATP
ncbi:uncharacterized protein LOC124706348 isoform X2 [Lolium rigidum]|uniref:uncharacterized protein LOC124706348 isoform X2 n=1 Tax=Lolium rigidum TaxID=89674 RepID=UPI001F5CF361|nr:uncharacterized protein LOC124706348 isoform X2 [Lolium rigidum]